MALRKILREGDPGLLKKSRVVKDFNKRLHILLDDMRETMQEAYGLGIAAPQVGVLRRAVLIANVPPDDDEPEQESEPEVDSAELDETEEQYDEGDEPEIIELINPEIIYEEGEQKGSEGCLSVPGQYGLVTRPQIVKVRAQDRYGKFFEFEGSGMTARAICHETNHLDGIIFTSLAERMLTKEEVDEMKKGDA